MSSFQQTSWATTARALGARLLLASPSTLLVASNPYEEYPQELVLRFVAPLVTETNGCASEACRPDAEIASDFAALLTLLCRRLVTVAGKVREQYETASVPPILADYLIPVALHLKVSHWSMRPLRFLHGPKEVEVISNHPPSVLFDERQISNALLALPQPKEAPAIIRAARLYASAMEQIEQHPESAYQLFISAVETIAGVALKNWEPDEKEKVASKRELVSSAVQTEKLDKAVAERLAVAASKGNPWSSRKFKRFIIDHLDTAAIATEDDLFMVPASMCPLESEIEKALGEIHPVRSGVTHTGQNYPASAVIGPSLRVPARAFDSLWNQERPFPPVGWFERVANCAICAYIRSLLSQTSSGSEEYEKEPA